MSRGPIRVYIRVVSQGELLKEDLNHPLECFLSRISLGFFVILAKDFLIIPDWFT